ncbi:MULTISPECIES: GNAT family N-acetyltransferase [unclassified Devosia]|uniref:GNAT family N-acetyltransferase n=1 Tax=unclassified Devosia TaxID=196773 RepID=UPI00145EAE60|nr:MULTISPECIES: GNAT family N-acetyltransferase [unclassified Devosia]MBJ6988254.1 GNAT family N-acetyltransferase [Devosia sp. MC521]QMW63233.1 GNAT family N-acetyltransferase [Devosia sp. MC521]
MVVTIRAITLGDAAGYNAVLGAVAREQKYLRMTDAPPIERTRNFVAHNIERRNPHLVAVNQDVVIGWCDICREPDMARHVGSLGMGVMSGFRGRGVGSALMKSALAAAKEEGFKRIELEVYASNTKAIALYERFGFEREGLRRKAVCIQNAWDDVVPMGLLWL